MEEVTSVADVPGKEPHLHVLTIEEEAVIVAFRARVGRHRSGRDRPSTCSDQALPKQLKLIVEPNGNAGSVAASLVTGDLDLRRMPDNRARI